MGSPTLLPLQRKLCCGLLYPLKIHPPQPCLNPQTLGPTARTTATIPQRATWLNLVLFIRFCSLSLHPVGFYSISSFISFLVRFPHVFQHLLLTDRTQFNVHGTREALVYYKIRFHLPHVGLIWDI
jgi:hypothetical protein